MKHESGFVRGGIEEGLTASLIKVQGGQSERDEILSVLKSAIDALGADELYRVSIKEQGGDFGAYYVFTGDTGKKKLRGLAGAMATYAQRLGATMIVLTMCKITGEC